MTRAREPGDGRDAMSRDDHPGTQQGLDRTSIDGYHVASNAKSSAREFRSAPVFGTNLAHLLPQNATRWHYSAHVSA
jgi:hypothetical protein